MTARRPQRDATQEYWLWWLESREVPVTARPKHAPTDVPYDDPYAEASVPSAGVKWAHDGATTAQSPGRDGDRGVPCIDDDPQDMHAFPRVYPAWGPGETFVVSGPLLPLHEKSGNGRPFATRRAARAWALEKYGAVLEEHLLKGRWSYRVPLPGPAGEKHRPKK